MISIKEIQKDSKSEVSKFGSEVPEIRSGLPKSDENVRNRTAASKIGQKGPDSEENFRTRL